MQLFLTFLLLSIFQPTIDDALNSIRNGDWNRAATLLDTAESENPDLFGFNNLHYLRGRVAESTQDWGRALDEFRKIPADNPLYALATWHAARAAIQIDDRDAALTHFTALPLDFPTEMKTQLAREAQPEFALRIYQVLTTRDARLEYALARSDYLALWALLRENNADDVGLRAARALMPRTLSPRDTFDVAQALLAHRQFQEAVQLFQSASADPAVKAEATFQIARVHFLSENYRLALETYEGVAKEFAGSDWQKDSEYQMASAYWRLGEYQLAAATYVDYINKYGGVARNEGAVRNLVDVYRAAGDNAKALIWLDRGLTARTTAATRQTLLFTKAKVLYIQERYTAALNLFQQLGRIRLRSAAGGTTRTEVRYYEALTLSKLKRTSAANAIWRQLAAEPFTYYGQKAAERLSQTSSTNLEVCQVDGDITRERAESNIEAMRRAVRTGPSITGDAVSELIFLKLWDEASLWLEQQARPDTRVAAQLAYLAGRYNRAIQYANRLPKSDPIVHGLLYPAGFRSLICSAAAPYQRDPLWLHAIIWQESKYNPSARSGASARGLMQFIPDTASTVAASAGLPPLGLDSLYDPAMSIQLGAHYWDSLLKEFTHPELALAAYNGGPDNVRRWKDKWREGDSEFFVADIGFVETKNYVMAVFGARAAYGTTER